MTEVIAIMDQNSKRLLDESIMDTGQVKYPCRKGQVNGQQKVALGQAMDRFGRRFPNEIK